ncbi:MAG TPA: hypothetical protein VFO31_14430 [Vicinamibacterales bacterium]|nr:hypothetical protein [Vicinamibacterales bacterium]
MVRWQKLFWISATVLTVACLAGVLARPAIAQIRAAVVKNVDEKGRIPFQATSLCVSAFPAPNCFVTFPAVPAGKRLVIEYVSAEFNLSPNFQPAAALTNVSGGINHPLPTFFRFGANYGVSSRLLLYAEAGQQPVLNAFGTSGSGNIAGYLVDLTQ